MRRRAQINLVILSLAQESNLATYNNYRLPNQNNPLVGRENFYVCPPYSDRVSESNGTRFDTSDEVSVVLWLEGFCQVQYCCSFSFGDAIEEAGDLAP